MTLQITTQIGKIETQQDRGVKLVMYTPELKAEEMTELFRLKNDGEMITVLEPIGRLAPVLANTNQATEGKSKSQQLRATLYRYWEQEWSGTTKFDDYYNTEMEKITSHYQSKLN